jgi:hypothetical protein
MFFLIISLIMIMPEKNGLISNSISHILVGTGTKSSAVNHILVCKRVFEHYITGNKIWPIYASI